MNVAAVDKHATPDSSYSCTMAQLRQKNETTTSVVKTCYHTGTQGISRDAESVDGGREK